MNVKDRARTRALRSLPVVLWLLLAGLAGATAMQTATSLPSLDPSCIRFDDPNAVANGEIIYAAFTAYQRGLDHALEAWSLDRGFSIALPEARPTGDEVPKDANLIYRDVSIPGSAFKGVTVTWSHAPATITFNRAGLPSPETTDPREQELIQAVVTHETGHALGLGDVPAPGVTIRECANMLMKRSVEKGGGHFTEPQPGDIALYCMRWGGTICGDEPRPVFTPDPSQAKALEPHAVAGEATVVDPEQLLVTYRYYVVKCEQLPAIDLTPEQVESDNLPTNSPLECVRAPVGVLFHVHRDDGSGEVVLTDRWGEFAFWKLEGMGVEVDMPHGGNGRFPSLVGYQPVADVDRISAIDPECAPGVSHECKLVESLTQGTRGLNQPGIARRSPHRARLRAPDRTVRPRSRRPSSSPV